MTTEPALGFFMTKAHLSPVSLTEVPVIQAFSPDKGTNDEEKRERQRRRKAARIFMTIEDTL